MMLPIILTILVLFCPSIFSSITIPNGKNLEAFQSKNNDLMSLINKACEKYFEPLEKNQKATVTQSWLNKFDQKGKTFSSSAHSRDSLPINSDDDLKTLQNQAAQKDLLLESCRHYCEYILNKEASHGATLISEVLNDPLKNFWQPARIGVLIEFMDFYFIKLNSDVETIEKKLIDIAADFPEHADEIQKSIDLSISLLKKKHEETFETKREELYNSIRNGNLFSFSIIQIEVEGLCHATCIDFFRKMCPVNNDTLTEEIFQIFFSHEKLNTIAFSERLIPNSQTIGYFLKSIIANQILINGCFQYIDSLPKKAYPTNVRAGMRSTILATLKDKYARWVETGFAANTPMSSLQQVEDEAMDTASSFYMDAIEKKVAALYPNLAPETLHNLVFAIKSALFSGINFNNYPELVATFEEGMLDFDRLIHNNQAAANELFSRAHYNVQHNTVPTKHERFIKKYRHVFKKIFIITCIITAYLLITKLIYAVRH